MTDIGHLNTSDTANSPHLSHLTRLGEQLTQTATGMAQLFSHDGITHDLTGAEFDALRQATAAARTAAGDVLLIASAARYRAVAHAEMNDPATAAYRPPPAAS